jgi:DNA-binding transcriptional MerR regulator
MLGVTAKHLRHMVRQGHIKPAAYGRRIYDATYRVEEINALLELKLRRVDLATVASVATQAHALSSSTATKLDQLCRFLGLENNRLSTDEEDVFLLYMRVQEALKKNFHEARSPELFEWAATINAIDEAYLDIVENFTLNKQPWSTYLDLANQLMDQRSAEADSNLNLAYTFLDTARKNLRHVAYFYVMKRQGSRLANDLFDPDEVTDEVIGQLFPRVFGPR